MNYGIINVKMQSNTVWGNYPTSRPEFGKPKKDEPNLAESLMPNKDIKPPEPKAQQESAKEECCGCGSEECNVEGATLKEVDVKIRDLDVEDKYRILINAVKDLAYGETNPQDLKTVVDELEGVIEE